MMRRNKYLRWALLNFVVLGIWGVLLRYLQFQAVPGFNFQNVLHGHSHFAFSGWMFLSLAVLIAEIIGISDETKSMKAIFVLTQLSSLGMLASFSLQGYKAVPIIFSTIFILLTYWFSYLVASSDGFRNYGNPVAKKLLGAALAFLCLSSLGPFALAPLMVNGLKGSPLYQNAIYFYLHFQMNGWMVLGGLGLLAARYLNGSTITPKQRLWLNCLVWSSVPLYLMFTLWSGPHWLFSVLTATVTVVHLVAWIKLCLLFKQALPRLPLLVRTAILAISLKSVFQVLICYPPIGEWVFLNRNLIIGYIHLITLASVTTLILDQFQARGVFQSSPVVELLNKSYVGGVILYLGILFLQPALALFGIYISHLHSCLLLISVFLVMIGIFYFRMSLNPAKVPLITSPQPA